MTKRRITVTLDEHLVERISAIGTANLSAIVNEALTEKMDRLVERKALREFLDQMYGRYGAPSKAALSDARRAFDELDGAATVSVT
jgi:hypothetical protein